MKNIGIDVGSTFTKFCVMDDVGEIEELFTERTPIHQKEYFEKKINLLKCQYEDDVHIVSCGYGKSNVKGIKSMNELSALSIGTDYIYSNQNTALDIGGQDTKIIYQENGKLREFYINDKCAAGSGLFLINTINLFGIDFDDIKLVPYNLLEIKLSSTCAVFAQSEIVEMIADNVDTDVIVSAVMYHILNQAKKLITKIDCSEIVLTGGLSQIANIKEYADNILGVKCIIDRNNNYLSAIGCACTR